MFLRNFFVFKDLFEVGEGVVCLEVLEYNCNEIICQYVNEFFDIYFMEEGFEEGDFGGEVENSENDVLLWRCKDSEMILQCDLYFLDQFVNYEIFNVYFLEKVFFY